MFRQTLQQRIAGAHRTGIWFFPGFHAFAINLLRTILAANFARRGGQAIFLDAPLEPIASRLLAFGVRSTILAALTIESFGGGLALSLALGMSLTTSRTGPVRRS